MYTERWGGCSGVVSPFASGTDWAGRPVVQGLWRVILSEHVQKSRQNGEARPPRQTNKTKIETTHRKRAHVMYVICNNECLVPSLRCCKATPSSRRSATRARSGTTTRRGSASSSRSISTRTASSSGRPSGERRGVGGSGGGARQVGNTERFRGEEIVGMAGPREGGVRRIGSGESWVGRRGNAARSAKTRAGSFCYEIRPAYTE